ncbi:MAG TPA: FecR domain-containing protein [Gemmatimonadaceae bacterium]|nr:FecR domain-containing protein [Gemmatimonadaceae bacterium]
MIDDFDWRVLDRFVAGEATPDEAAAVERWLTADPQRQGLVAGMRAARDSADAARRWDTDAAWHRLSERMSAAPVARRRGPPPAPGLRVGATRPWRQRPLAIPMAIAAAALLAVAAVMWQFVGESAGRSALQQIATGRGERRELRLADGSRVLLGVESRLRYPTSFDGARDVHLSGEAYFEVAHDAGRPFTVHAAHSLTRVLGTTFAVRAYPGTQAVHVVVTSGRVSLRARSASRSAGAVLTPGQRGTLAPDGQMTVDATPDVERSLAWMQGELVLDNVSLTDAVRELARWYDIEVRIGDPALAARRVSAVFRNEVPERAIEAVALAADARLEWSGRTVTLRTR